jgi:hypothetical protein
MGKNKQDEKDKQENYGQANREAWEAARKVAKKRRKDYKDKEWSKLPWREIRNQLRQSGDTIDTTLVPVTWTSESPQMSKMLIILEEAGFKKEDHLYRWEGKPPQKKRDHKKNDL